MTVKTFVLRTFYSGSRSTYRQCSASSSTATDAWTDGSRTTPLYPLRVEECTLREQKKKNDLQECIWKTKCDLRLDLGNHEILCKWFANWSFRLLGIDAETVKNRWLFTLRCGRVIEYCTDCISNITCSICNCLNVSPSGIGGLSLPEDEIIKRMFGVRRT